MRNGARRLGIEPERQVAALLVHDFVRLEAVVLEQMRRLIQPVLPQRRRRLHRFHRRPRNGPEGAEVRMVHAAALAELGDHPDQRLVRVGRGADHELHGHPRHAPGVQRIGGPAGPAGRTLADHEAPNPLEVAPCGAPALVRRDLRQGGPAGGLEVERDPAGQAGEPLDLRVVRARHQLDVDVPAEAVSLPQQGQRLDELVDDSHRPARDPRGDEEPVAPVALQRAEEDPHQLQGFEQRAGQLAITPHRAVVTIEAAGVGHQHPEQPGGAPLGPEVSDVEGAEHAGLADAPQPGRGRLAVPVVGRERHQNIEPGFQVGAPHGPPNIPNKPRKAIRRLRPPERLHRALVQNRVCPIRTVRWYANAAFRCSMTLACGGPSRCC